MKNEVMELLKLNEKSSAFSAEMQRYAEAELLPSPLFLSTQLSSVFDQKEGNVSLSDNETAALEAAVSFARRGEKNICTASMATLESSTGLDRKLIWNCLRRIEKRTGLLRMVKLPHYQFLNHKGLSVPDPNNSWHWRTHIVFHPVLVDAASFKARLLLSLENLIELNYDKMYFVDQTDGLRYGKKHRIEEILVEENRPLRDRKLIHSLNTVEACPTAEGEKRPLFSDEDRKALSQLNISDAIYRAENILVKVPAGYVVLDFDTPESRRQFVSSLTRSERKAFFNTLTVQTPRGFHHWFRLPKGMEKLPYTTYKFDIRSEGQWVILPNGKDRITAGDYMRTMPAGMWTRLRRRDRCARTSVIIDDSPIEKGARNNTLFRIGLALRDKFKTWTEFLRQFLYHSTRCTTPLSQRELYRLADHCWSYGRKV